MSFKNYFNCIFAFVFCGAVIVAAKRPFNIYFTELECSHHDELVKDFQCKYLNTNDRTIIDGFLIFSEDITAFQVRAQCDVMRTAGSPSVKLFDLDVDGCQILQLDEANNIVHVMLDFMRKSGRMPDRCPMVAKENYSVSNFLVDPDMLPLYTPECSFALDMKIHIGPKILTQVKIKGNIDSKKKKLI